MRIIFIFFLVFVSCSKSEGKTSVSGSTSKSTNLQTQYIVPVNGFFNAAISHPIEFNNDGHFTLAFETDSVFFLQLNIDGKRTDIILENGSDIDISTSLDEGLKAYNELSKSPHIYFDARKFMRYQLNEIPARLESLHQKKQSVFDAMLESKVISPQFYAFVKMDLDCYFKALESSVYTNHFFKRFNQGGEMDAKWIQKWEQVFSDGTVQTKQYAQSKWYSNLLENYVRFSHFKKQSFDFNRLQSTLSEGVLTPPDIEITESILTKEYLEFYTSYSLIHEYFQLDFEKSTLKKFNNFKNSYPKSAYLSFMSPLMKKIEVYHNTEKLDGNDDFKLLHDYDQIDTFQQLLSSFKGSKLYVDVWATWCGPCKAEFKFKSSLDSLRAIYNVDILYISTDKEEKEEKWRNEIVYYDLKGYHIRANPLLDKELRMLFDKNNQNLLQLPWYVLIDEKGKIRYQHAAKPSEIDQLAIQFKAIY